MIAEFVETEPQVKLLEARTARVSGYLFSKAIERVRVIESLPRSEPEAPLDNQ